MKIEIKNLGIIKSADVDLSNNLTVFTGPNNSGKTYLAYLIYAITKASYKPYDDSDFKLDFQNMIKNKSTIHRIDINRIKEYRKKHLSIINSDLDSLFGISNELSNNLFKDFYVNITETDDEFLKRVENLAITIKVSVGRNSYSIIKNENTLDISMVFEGDEFDSEELKYLDIIIHSKIYFYLAFSPFTNSYIFASGTKFDL
ncbi:AAA family ATPase [Sphingobacterium daejeonense]|uniref:AAA family ATPase n=1 Tax=Sphingobacterium daejeonense TaxID=371142 RepID=UPI0010C4D3C2|nr:AAA family ATPase [Sphingobacterium daejeonense]VTQ01804.1 Uncharacterized conserved protein [Sphingobacterium daejeonense]